jgi:hypothetical protein
LEAQEAVADLFEAGYSLEAIAFEETDSRKAAGRL